MRPFMGSTKLRFDALSASRLHCVSDLRIIVDHNRGASTPPLQCSTTETGAIFDESDLREEEVFRAAVEAVNSNRKLLAHSRLSAIVETVSPGDSMAAYKKACSMLRTGVAAIFGGPWERSSVQVACDHLEVPLLQARWQHHRPPFVVNLYPKPETLAAAYRSVVRALGWREFAVVCDSDDGLVRVKEVIKDSSLAVTLRELPGGLDYRELLKEIKMSGVVHILLDVHRSKIHSILKQAQQIGLMTAYHHYFITSLDLYTVDLEDFRYGGTNITALRLIDLNNGALQQILRDWSTDLDNSGNIFGGEIVAGYSFAEVPNIFEMPASVSPQSSALLPDYIDSNYPTKSSSSSSVGIRDKLHVGNFSAMPTELALVYDAVQLFAKALSDLDKSRAIEVMPLDCSSDQVWPLGATLVNYIKWVQLYGFSGLIRFDADGSRSDVKMDIVQLKENGLDTVGRWDLTAGVNFSLPNHDTQRRPGTHVHNSFVRIITVLSTPFVMKSKAYRPEAASLPESYEGFAVDLAFEVARLVGFNYSVDVVRDASYGDFSSAQQRWTGLIGELVEERADMAIADLTITLDRQRMVDFSSPWMNYGLGALYRSSSLTTASPWLLLAPLRTEVWLGAAGTYALLLLVSGYISR
ncbi:Receptor ligand binding region [Trinorchestia longiramus]|nr:Receptor ligand binding region [Trinorchestia longiramus]